VHSLKPRISILSLFLGLFCYIGLSGLLMKNSGTFTEIFLWMCTVPYQINQSNQVQGVRGPLKKPSHPECGREHLLSCVWGRKVSFSAKYDVFIFCFAGRQWDREALVKSLRALLSRTGRSRIYWRLHRPVWTHTHTHTHAETHTWYGTERSGGLFVQLSFKHQKIDFLTVSFRRLSGILSPLH